MKEGSLPPAPPSVPGAAQAAGDTGFASLPPARRPLIPPLRPAPARPEVPFPSPAAELKDSGERREFATGAVRDMSSGKGSFDLIPVHGLMLVAKQMERGKGKYGARNWEKGMPLSAYLDSGLRHLMKFQAGYDDEPHLDAALWNLLCLAEGRRRVEAGIWPAEFDDLPKTFAGKVPNF